MKNKILFKIELCLTQIFIECSKQYWSLIYRENFPYIELDKASTDASTSEKSDGEFK